MNAGYVFYDFSAPSVLYFLLKLLAFVTVFAFVAGVVTWLKDSHLKNPTAQDVTQTVKVIKNDPTLKYGVGILLTGLGLFFLIPLLKFAASALGDVYNLDVYVLTSTLLFIAKILGLILVGSLIIVATQYLKSQYRSGKLNFFKTRPSAPIDIQTTNSDNQSKEVIPL